MNNATLAPPAPPPPVQVRWMCPDVPWFCDLEHCIEDLKSAIRTGSGNKYELEARVGTLHTETQKFVPGLLQSDGDLLLKKVFPVSSRPKWDRLRDVHYEGGYRRRNDGPLVRKRVLKSHTFLTSNGFAFRLAISIETQLSAQDEKGLGKLTETLRRDRTRWTTFNSTKEWQYDFTFNAAIKQMEVEIEAGEALVSKKPDKAVWDLAYRMCHLVYSLRSTLPEVRMSNGTLWPIHCQRIAQPPPTNSR